MAFVTYCSVHLFISSNNFNKSFPLFSKLKASPCSLRLELMIGSDQLDSGHDRKTLLKLGIKDKTIVNAKLSQVDVRERKEYIGTGEITGTELFFFSRNYKL